jgi:16S rRNA (guanine527-N7)-methyltransferase
MRFETESFKKKLIEVFDINGFGAMLNEERIDKFVALTEILLEENEKYNLTAIKDPDKIILNHYADCAALCDELPEGAKIADIGCGAGFPTLPVAILRPDLHITGIDSTAKRIAYVNMAAEKIGAKNVNAITARAEDVGRSEMREKFDIVTARAVAALPILTELCLPLVKLGGRMVAMKGKNAIEELSASKNAIKLLGGKIYATKDIRLTDGEEEFIHPLIVIDKKAATPKSYPRAYAQISKKPL